MEIEPEKEEFYSSFLLESELERYRTISHKQKKLEFAATRYLKHRLYGAFEINYTESKSPYIQGINKHISISHTMSYVAIGENQTFPIGIDIEECRDKATTLASKFTTREEKTIFDVNSSKEMSLLWSFKEMLYKLSDRRELIFKKDILVSKGRNQFCGRVLKTDGMHEYDLDKIEYENILITCNTSTGKKI